MKEKVKKVQRETKRKQANGITLIALVITIIVLLILAGVSIAMLTEQNGILTQAQNAKNRTEEAQGEEENRLNEYNNIINNYVNGGTTTTTGSTLGTVTGNETSNTTVQDSLGNKVVVPAGFKVYIPEGTNLEDYNVEDGIVIEDVNHEATAGSQFVWIPVGAIHKKDKEDITIKLSRYTFDDAGTPTDQGSDEIPNRGNSIVTYYQEVSTSKYGNTPAKENIESETEGFRGSAIKNGGYYIGRYEARTATERTDKNNPETQITVKPDEFVYNYVTQMQAADLSRNMYSDSNFESDLVNSYAWDTAIDFLQKCDDRVNKTKPYSRQNSLNTGRLATQGTNNLETKDQICNIYDMASNCYEWTTEVLKAGGASAVYRGGQSYDRTTYTALRSSNAPFASLNFSSFRPLLYL